MGYFLSLFILSSIRLFNEAWTAHGCLEPNFFRTFLTLQRTANMDYASSSFRNRSIDEDKLDSMHKAARFRVVLSRSEPSDIQNHIGRRIQGRPAQNNLSFKALTVAI